MPNSYRKILLHIVFAVKNRDALLHKSWRGKVFEYIAGTIKQRGHFSLAVNGVENHIHILVDYKGHELIEDLVREIKKASTKFIKENKLSKYAFNWQSGYAAFSVGYSQLDTVIKYILRQEQHHRKNSFRNEYLFLLNKYEIEYKDQYLFDFLD